MAPENKIREKLQAAEGGAPVWNSDRVWASLEINKKKKVYMIWWPYAAASVVILLICGVLYKMETMPEVKMAVKKELSKPLSPQKKKENEAVQIASAVKKTESVSTSVEPKKIRYMLKINKPELIGCAIGAEVESPGYPQAPDPVIDITEISQIPVKPEKKVIRAIIGGGPTSSPAELYAARRSELLVRIGFNKTISNSDTETASPLAFKATFK